MMQDDQSRKTEKVPMLVSEQVRPNRLFLELAACLNLQPDQALPILSLYLERLEVTPATLARDHLRALEDDLLRLVSILVLPQERPRARSRITRLLLGD